MKRMIENFKVRKQERIAFKKELKTLKSDTLKAYKDFQKLFEDKNRYVSLNEMLDWQDRHEELHDRVSIILQSKDFKYILRVFRDDLNMIIRMFKLIEKYRKRHNKPVVDKMIGSVDQSIFNINGVILNKEQKTAVVVDEKRLRLIGAGTSGLTHTCVGKVKYLVKGKNVPEDNILFLTNSGKNADKVNRMLEKEGISPIAKTYIDYSAQVLADHGKEVPDVVDVDYEEFAESTIKKLLEEEEYKSRFVDYYLNFRQAGSVVFDFDDYEDYLQFLEEYPPIALDGTRMKNYEHLAVADFLYRNNIRYRYMQDYCVRELDYDGTSYKPVFYLPDFDIYIEVFEINAAGEARFDTGTSLVSETPTEIYKKRMQRIREIHEKNHTVMVDVFTYELMESTLVDHLQTKLMKHLAVFAPMSANALLKIILERNPFLIREISVVLGELLQLARDNSETWQEIIFLNRESMKTKTRWYKRNESVFSLLMPVYETYLNYIGDNTDAFGIVQMASETIRLQRRSLGYTHIIVDDFHNTNRHMLNLLRNVWHIVMDKASIIVAGNDWQTKSGICAYDFSYFTEFSRFFGHSESIKFTRVFSQGQRLWSMNARFVERNTMQVRKYARCEMASPRDCVTLLSYECKKEDTKSLFDENEIEIMKNTLQNYINSLPNEYSVILVGRFKEDIVLASKMNLSDIPVKTVYDLDESADVVIVINARRYNMGFPDRMMGENVKSLFGIKPELYAFASERRLWHQAVSRARVKVAFLFNSENRSRFIEEYI